MMGNDPSSSESGGTAVWYFVGATFLFAGSTFLGSADDGGASPFGIIAGIAGAVVLVAGLWVFSREWKGKRK